MIMATQDEIWSAADELVARGERPTLVAVRHALGGGSYTTISEGLKAWRARGRAQVEAPELPEAVRDTLQRALQSVWQAASDAARTEVESTRAALEARERALVQERAEALELADELSRQQEATRAESEHLRAELQRVQSAADQADGRAREREAHIQALERDLREAREAQQGSAAQVSRLEAEVEHLRQDLSTRTHELEQARKAASELSGLRAEPAEDLRLEIARLQERVTATDRRADEWRAEAERLQALWAQWTPGQAPGPEPPKPHGAKRRDGLRRKTPQEG
jgi:chromosome segregation ATPase